MYHIAYGRLEVGRMVSLIRRTYYQLAYILSSYELYIINLRIIVRIIYHQHNTHTCEGGLAKGGVRILLANRPGKFRVLLANSPQSS